MKEWKRIVVGQGDIVTWRTGLMITLISLSILIFLRQNVDIRRFPLSPVAKQDVQLSANEIPQLDIEYVENNILSLDQSDPQLVRYTRIKYLTPPSKLAYNFKNSSNHKDVFSTWVAKVFKNKRNGTFIEVGANEGEYGSHTLYLEKDLGWSGLLIECNPKLIPSLKSHHRKAWIADVCLSTTATPGILNFSNPTNWTYSGTFRQPYRLPVGTQWEIFEVQTMPLFTLLAALGWTEVDYFSFDIEGMELSVLRNFPFDSFIFKVLVIEIYFYSADQRKELHDLLTSNRYRRVRAEAWDWYYIHNSFGWANRQKD